MRKVILAFAASVGLAWIDIGAAQPSVPIDAAEQSSEAQVVEELPVVSSDGQNVGQVASVDRAADGSVKSIRAEINGFLGLGTGMVTISSDEFQVDGKRIVLGKTADEVRGVPSPSHQSFDGAGDGSSPSP